MTCQSTNQERKVSTKNSKIHHHVAPQKYTLKQYYGKKKNIIFAPVVFLSLITFSTTVAKQLAIDRALSFRQQQQ